MKLAVIGSSHTGCVRQCHDRARAARPDLDIDYFALPGAPYRRAERGSDGILRARPVDEAEARKIRKINGATEIDLTPFDQVWAIGNRFGLGRILRLLTNYDILELRRTGRKATISQAFFRAAMRAEVEASCTRIAAQFGPDPRLTFTPAPYPAETVAAPGPHHEGPVAHAMTHPEAAQILAWYEATIRDALAAQGYGFMPQPATTRAAPFATRADYLRDARDFSDLDRQLQDARHMNADYGLALFSAYAELHPGDGSSIPYRKT